MLHGVPATTGVPGSALIVACIPTFAGVSALAGVITDADVPTVASVLLY